MSGYNEFMFAAISISLFVSITATLEVFFDWIWGHIPLSFTAILSMGLTCYLMRRWVRQGGIFWKSEKHFLQIFIFVAITGYLIYPVLWHMTPLSLEWDGSNHLVLLTKIFKFSNHKNLVDAQYYPIYGTSSAMWDYPWGFHGTVAALSALTHIPPVHLIYPCAMAAIGLSLTALAGWCLKRRIHFLAIAPVILFLLFLTKGIYAIVHHNYWSQSMGLLACVGLFSFLHYSSSHETVDVPILSVLIAGITQTYPLFIFGCAPGLIIFGYLKNKKLLISIFISFLIGFILSAPAVIPYIARNMKRFHRSGPPFWGEGSISTDWVTLSLFVMGLAGSLYLLLKEKKTEMSLAVGVLLGFAPLIIIKANQYWIWKQYMLTMFFMIPPLAYALHQSYFESFHDFKLNITRNSLKIVGSALVIFALFSHSSFDSCWKLEPVFTQDDLEMAKWTAQNYGANKIFYVVHPPKIPWLEALEVAPAPLVNDAVIKKIRRLERPRSLEFLYDEFPRVAKDNVLVAFHNRSEGMTLNGLTLLKQFGPWEIYQWKKS